MQVLRRSKKICSFSAAFLKIRRKAAEKPAFTQSCVLFLQGTTGIFSWKGCKLYFSQSEMLISNVQLGYVLTRGGGQAVQGGLSCPPPRISERIDNMQILLHHLLQEYLVEGDVNFISVNLRCLLQTFSWVTYWQGVGGKLSRAVYLAPRPEFQREWIIRKFYYTIYYRNI